jgi:hypothetical protein
LEQSGGGYWDFPDSLRGRQIKFGIDHALSERYPSPQDP